MSKTLVELYTVLGQPPDSVLLAKVWIQKPGDLYVANFASVLAGKYSYHASGVGSSPR